MKKPDQTKQPSKGIWHKRIPRFMAILALAISATTVVTARPANACGIICCTPYTYLQFCCFGCLNFDLNGEVQAGVAVSHDISDLTQLITQANRFRQELENDVTILSTVGKQRPNIKYLMRQFLYNQGIYWQNGSVSVDNQMQNFRDLYMVGESTTNISSVPADAYAMMQQDIEENASDSMGYSSNAMQQTSADMTDITNYASLIDTTTTIGEDIQLNSEIKEKLVELELLHTELMGQYLGIESRTAAAAQQTDLSPPNIPTQN
jgi:hypothetical protein